MVLVGVVEVTGCRVYKWEGDGGLTRVDCSLFRTVIKGCGPRDWAWGCAMDWIRWCGFVLCWIGFGFGFR